MKLTRPRYHDKVVPEPTMHVTAQWALYVRFQLRPSQIWVNQPGSGSPSQVYNDIVD